MPMQWYKSRTIELICFVVGFGLFSSLLLLTPGSDIRLLWACTNGFAIPFTAWAAYQPETFAWVHALTLHARGNAGMVRTMALLGAWEIASFAVVELAQLRQNPITRGAVLGSIAPIVFTIIFDDEHPKRKSLRESITTAVQKLVKRVAAIHTLPNPLKAD